MKPFNEIHNISEAIQQALYKETLEEAIEYICLWEEDRHKYSYGYVVRELLKIYGININKIGLR